MKYKVGDTAEQLPFPIGTKVICSYQSGDSFTGIFQGQSETHGDCWAIERYDIFTGGAQNSWWNWDKEFTMEKIRETITYDGIVYSATGAFENHLPRFSESALEPAEPLGEHKPFNHLINNKFMSIKNKIKMLMTGEPEKTLIKHGILTIDKELTCDGKQLFNEFIENKFKEEFLKGMYEVLKDEKVDNSAQ